MTATATVDFSHAAKLHAVLLASRFDELKVRPEPSVIQDMLALLVSVGVLTPEQAHELWKLIDGGVVYPLPPLPRPDKAPNTVDPYEIFRIATLVPREPSAEFDVVDDVVGAIVDAIVQHVLPPVIEAIGDAIDAVGSWLSGLFS